MSQKTSWPSNVRIMHTEPAWQPIARALAELPEEAFKHERQFEFVRQISIYAAGTRGLTPKQVNYLFELYKTRRRKYRRHVLNAVTSRDRVLLEALR